MKPQSNLKEASIRTRGVARAGLQLVGKFREQLNLRDTECAGGRVVRRAQCDHRPHEAPIGIAEIRGVATQQCRQHVLKRCYTRCDCFPLSTRSRPRPASTDSSGFRHFQPFELLATKRSLSPKGQEQLSHCREIGLALAGVDAPALRSCALVASRCAPVRSFAARNDHKRFKAWPGLPRESVNGNPWPQMKSRRRVLLWRLECAVEPAGLAGFQRVKNLSRFGGEVLASPLTMVCSG